MLTETELDACSLGKLFGGLPEGGWFGVGTEYEIGLQRVAEAIHCILGSIGAPIRGSLNKLSTEVGHINEEVGIILRVNEEYSLPVYKEHLLISDYKDQSLESMETSANRLIERAEKMKSRIRTEDSLYRAAGEACYDAVIALGEATLLTLRVYQNSGNIYSHPVANRDYLSAVQVMIDRLRELIEAYGEGRTFRPQESIDDHGNGERKL
jgi:hypothetical protein